MERRRFPRQDVQGTPLKVTLVLTGDSLLKKDFSNVIEIDCRPVNLSQSGICLSPNLDATWLTFSPRKELLLYLETDGQRLPVSGRVIHAREKGHLLGMEFSSHLEDISRFLVPKELQNPI